jgi:MFS-type transporter involved in bile tolerance (Atg22 family)
VPVILTLVSTALFIVIRPEGRTDALGVLTVFLYQYFVVTPAIGGVFIAGFLAQRASWLYGILVGLVAAACYSFLVLRGFIGTAPNTDTQTLARDVVLASFLLSPLIGAFFASTAAWYRRFLALSNPNRGRPRGAPPRPDGRSRSAANQKAGVRR